MKLAAEATNALLAGMIIQPKLKPGQDPKSVLCELFRHGKCKKGDNCKYSHDKDVEMQRKGPKINLFEDARDEKPEGMEGWTQEDLEKAIAQKHGAESGRPNKTKIICKHFLDAVERRLYGWFWKCPSGDGCQYRHALPPGYVLKSEMQAMLAEEKANAVDISETIEAERRAVKATTKITDEVFKQWREKKVVARRAAMDAEKAKRLKAGKLTGREIFETEGFEAEDDAGAGGGDDYARETNWEDEEREMAEQAAKAMEAARALDGLALNDAEADDLFDDDDDDEDFLDEVGAGPSGA